MILNRKDRSAMRKKNSYSWQYSGGRFYFSLIEQSSKKALDCYWSLIHLPDCCKLPTRVALLIHIIVKITIFVPVSQSTGFCPFIEPFLLHNFNKYPLIHGAFEFLCAVLFGIHSSTADKNKSYHAAHRRSMSVSTKAQCHGV